VLALEVPCSSRGRYVTFSRLWSAEKCLWFLALLVKKERLFGLYKLVGYVFTRTVHLSSWHIKSSFDYSVWRIQTICSEYSIICCTQEMSKFIQVGWHTYTLLCSSYLFSLWYTNPYWQILHTVLKEFKGYTSKRAAPDASAKSYILRLIHPGTYRAWHSSLLVCVARQWWWRGEEKRKRFSFKGMVLEWYGG
jgi:hypothetical protein